MTFDRPRLKNELASIAEKGVFLGTSSWKYPGWCGQLYDESRYLWRGRFAESRFDRLCLSEYAEVFKTVCVDAAYYKFPDARYLEGLVSQVPSDFQFSLKVTDDITIKTFPNLPRFGARAGKSNEHFLDAELFASAFIGPCESFRKNIGILIFEFSRSSAEEFQRGREFAEVLDPFLERLPKGWRYGIEIRNRNYLHTDYFAMLARRGVAHIYNSWTAMPSLAEQIAMPESRTCSDFLGARLLLKPGRRYEEAVSLFQPYSKIKDPNLDGRAAVVNLIRGMVTDRSRAKTYIYVNNRFEGNALETILALLEAALR